MFLQNVSWLSPDYTALHPRSHNSSMWMVALSSYDVDAELSNGIVFVKMCERKRPEQKETEKIWWIKRLGTRWMVLSERQTVVLFSEDISSADWSIDQSRGWWEGRCMQNYTNLWQQWAPPLAANWQLGSNITWAKMDALCHNKLSKFIGSQNRLLKLWQA
jgi:hypothetical protein